MLYFTMTYFSKYGIFYLNPFDLTRFLQQVMIYRKVQICKGKISFQVHSGWALTVCILLQKESFYYFPFIEQGRKRVIKLLEISRKPLFDLAQDHCYLTMHHLLQI